MISVKFTKNGNKLNISLPVEQPRPSASGKSELIATSGGWARTDAIHEGRRVYVNCNALVYPNEPKPTKKGGKAKRPSDGDAGEE